MDAETSGVGAPRDPGLRVRRHQGRARRRSRSGDRGDGQVYAGRQRRHTEDEPAQLRQERRHGRADVPKRSVRAPQHQGPILLRTDIRELYSVVLPLRLRFCWLRFVFVHDFVSL